MAPKKRAKRASPKRKPSARQKPAPKASATQEASQVSLLHALRDSIDRDITERISTHKRVVARIRKQIAEGAPRPLMLLAHGDSWFNYPLTGNTLPIGDTDIIAHLRTMGTPPPRILNISHFGDATTDELGLPKQKRLIAALHPDNWLDGKPDAILFSGGGNDIAGDQFCIWLNYEDSGKPGLDPIRFPARLASIQASYEDLLLFRDRYAPHVKIFGHDYDFPHPMEPHPPCTGPWMKPSLGFTGWNDAEGTKILHDALDQFRAMLLKLTSSEFIVVPTQTTLAYEDWANELHPYPDGFKKLAQVFIAKVREHFPGRI